MLPGLLREGDQLGHVDFFDVFDTATRSLARCAHALTCHPNLGYPHNTTCYQTQFCQRAIPIFPSLRYFTAGLVAMLVAALSLRLSPTGSPTVALGAPLISGRRARYVSVEISFGKWVMGYTVTSQSTAVPIQGGGRHERRPPPRSGDAHPRIQIHSDRHVLCLLSSLDCGTSIKFAVVLH